MSEVSKAATQGGGLGWVAWVFRARIRRARRTALAQGSVGVSPANRDPAPVDESELAFVSEFTRTRMTLDYQMTQGGQTVYYQARWVSTRGETGPWGELVSATVVK